MGTDFSNLKKFALRTVDIEQLELNINHKIQASANAQTATVTIRRGNASDIPSVVEMMAAIVPGDKPYMRTSVFENFKKRIPWLLLLMVSSAFTGAIITSFEEALSVNAALIAFIPMLMGTGGNAGGQASVTVIRGLSMGEIEYRDVPGIMWKEMRVAILCGLCLAIANFGKLMVFDRSGIMVAFAVSLTLVVVVLMAMLIGCVLPVLAKRIGFDPAVMASPFITTIVDALSLLIYFRVAMIVLGITV